MVPASFFLGGKTGLEKRQVVLLTVSSIFLLFLYQVLRGTRMIQR